jgi:hypothetical protein
MLWLIEVKFTTALRGEVFRVSWGTPVTVTLFEKIT